MKNFNDTMGNRARILTACSVVPELSAPARIPENKFSYPYLKESLLI